MTGEERVNMGKENQFAEIIFPDGSTVRAYPVPDTESDIIFILSEADKGKAAGDFVRAAAPNGNPTAREAVTLRAVRAALKRE